MTHTIVKPPHIQPGDTVGIISPSFGAAGLFPQRLEAGIRQLEDLGYRTRLAAHAQGVRNYVSGTPEERASDLMEMFSDTDVSMVLSAIGGDHACQLLPLIDFATIAAHPKIFMGFSDTSVLNLAIHQKTGLVTFNGPALMTDFAEYPHILDYTLQSLARTLASPAPAGEVLPAAEWTEEFLDWGDLAVWQRPRAMRPSPGWTWLKPGVARGRLFGGCLESLQHLRGTSYWPDWHEAIFFWELSEEHPSPETVDSLLMDYENMGVFEQIAGMLVGRPFAYTPQMSAELRQTILERTRKWNIPIVTDMDFGHTSPQFILPIGCRAEIDSTRQRFTLLEAAVS